MQRAQSHAGNESGFPGRRLWRADLEALLRQCESQPSLFDAEHFTWRADLLDRLEVAADPAIGCQVDASEQALLERTHALMSRFERANAALFAQLRNHIRNGNGPAALKPWIAAGDNSAAEIRPGLSYDWRDDLVAGILQLENPDGPAIHPGGEMVFYQPTPARHIFNLLLQLRLQPHDTLIDLGSGMGHVPLLAALATPARCLGIELETAYVARARDCAADLGMINVTFVEGDVREADLSAGTVFYLYTPFTGALLKSVLDRLRIEALQRPIAVGTFGPCTETVANEGLLEPDCAAHPDRISVFRSRLKRA